VIGVLALRGISRGLEPLARLTGEIDRRTVRGAVSLRPLHTSLVPEEALAPVVAFSALLERLEHTTGSVRRFTADASHQVRTPLAARDCSRPSSSAALRWNWHRGTDRFASRRAPAGDVRRTAA